MQFSRLRLAGFKSFADPTELVIEPGLTGVVGPNGCGKSNLLEALRWVMGENRPSIMRGDGMEDVIFAGSASRPARNHAEVVLTLDNRDRRAPAGFNDADTLEIVRRIGRDAGSTYRLAGREVRARDVQVLFADASTGAQSPALVRQGQIAELVNARPRARRRVLEEAAGISGLYQRRHEAELKLRATETNLGRVDDVLEALQSQVGQLSRQARQAARYREIAEALRRVEGLLLWREWRDAEDENANAAAMLLAATRATGAAEASAAASARARLEAEATLPGLRDEEAIAGALMQRLAIEADRLEDEAAAAVRAIAALEAQLAQVASDQGREVALAQDADETITRLVAEKAGLERERGGHDAGLAAARAALGTTQRALEIVEAELDVGAETAARLVAEHRAAERAQAENRSRRDQLKASLGQAETALGQSTSERAIALESRARAVDEAEAAGQALAAAEAALTEAEARAGAARQAAAEATARLAETEGTAKALLAETAALERALAATRSDEAKVLDAIDVRPGFEAALGAALGDDADFPLLAGDGTGWRELPPLALPAPLPAGVELLAPQVRAPNELSRRLEAVGIVDRTEGARLQEALGPGGRLVSREGDLWRWDGLVVGAGTGPTSAALRLQQKNRLTQLDAERLGLEGGAEDARRAAQRAAEVAGDAASTETAARGARRQADQRAAEATRLLGRAETAAETIGERIAALTAVRARRVQECDAAEEELARAEGAAAELADPGEARTAVEAARARVEAARNTMLARRAEADHIERAAAARARRLDEIAGEIGGWKARQTSAAGRLDELDGRSTEAEAALAEARLRPTALEARRAELGDAIAAARTRHARAADALAAAETELRQRDGAARTAERAAGEAREARARAGALAEAAASRAAAAADRVRAEAECVPADLLASLGTTSDEVPASAELEAEANRLRRAREALGPVNLRAEEDAREVRGELEELTRERDDLQEAIGKLRQGIANLNREGRGRLLAAFEQVNRNFGTLFTSLFGGGEASLVLVESDDPLEAGLEIMCQPPGKKLATLSLLSGGEQSLTALSLIFAVFLANPSPICVLDEVDAPLDDANVGRFCNLLDEMTRRTDTRFLIITHHAVTMAHMDRLFGVTMAELGVSQLVSVDLVAAERIVDEETFPAG